MASPCCWYEGACSGGLAHHFTSLGAVCWLVCPVFLPVCVWRLEEAGKQKSHILQPFCIFCVNDCEFYFSLAMAALMGEANKQFTSMRTYLRPNLFLTDDSSSLPLASKKARWALLSGSNAASPIVCNWSRRDTAISVIASLCKKAFVFVTGFVLIWARRHIRVSSVIKIAVDSYFTGKSALKREQGKCAYLHRRNLKECFQYLS